jgi:hypothetical protein
VSDFASRLASALALPFVPCLTSLAGVPRASPYCGAGYFVSSTVALRVAPSAVAAVSRQQVP